MRTHLIVPKAPRRRYSRLSLEQLEDRQLLAVCDPNGDGVVDRNDAARLAMHYGTASGATERDGDCDGDGAVSLADAAMLQSQVGQRNLDFGDAPQRYRTLLGDDGARHVIRAGFHLGTSIDRDSNGQPSIAANADDMDANGDDEDGVFFLTAPVPGVPQRVRVDASASGVLDAFVDWNRDEDWDDVGEQIFAGQALAAGANFLPYSVPATAIASTELPTYARFRLSSGGGLGPRGPATDGEVEDYALFVVPAEFVPAPIDVSTIWDWQMDVESAEQMPAEFKVEATGPAEFRVGPAVNTDNGRPFGLGGPDTLPSGMWHIDTELLEMNLAGTWSTSGDADDRPTEEVAFYYNKIAFTRPSLGALMLTSLPNGGWAVDSFVDITYRIDFVESGMSLLPQGGSTPVENFGTFPAGIDKAQLVDLVLSGQFPAGGIGQPLVDAANPQMIWDYLRGLRTQTPRLDWGDAPDPTYPTLAASTGAAHVIRPGYSLGAAVDAEVNGQTSPLATRDDTTGMPDDEDGVAFTSLLIPGGTTTVDLTATGGVGYLNAWIDFNRDGDWSDAGEQIFTSELLAMGVNSRSFAVPATALADSAKPTISRWRFSRQKVLGVDGVSSSGEVEDHAVFVYAAQPAPVVATLPWEWDLGFNELDGEGNRRGEPRMASLAGEVGIQYAAPIVQSTGQTFDLLDPDAMPEGEDVLVRTSIFKGELVGIEPFYTLPEKDDEVLVSFEHGDIRQPVVIGALWGRRSGSMVFPRVGWEMSLEFTANHPDFAWLPTYNPAPAEFGALLPPTGMPLQEFLSAPLYVALENVPQFWLFARTTQTPIAPAWIWESVHGRPARNLDWGDAPDPMYPTLAASNGARHRVVPGLSLGALVDIEANGQPSAGATRDDTTGPVDDEDGVAFAGPLVVGSPATVSVTASAAGYLNAWIDFNRDGDWLDADEQVFTSQLVSPGVNTLSFAVPFSAVPAGAAPTISRWRLSTQKLLAPTGIARDGEVEDHAVMIAPRTLPGSDYGDAPDRPYPTLAASGGASHFVVAGFHLGRAVDPDPDGQPDAVAMRDDANGAPDDEDGVTLAGLLVQGGATAITVEASAAGILNAWVDWNRNGVWEAGGEQIFVDRPLTPGMATFPVAVPATAVAGPTYARFRFSHQRGLAPGGPAEDGEVEDYLWEVLPGDEQPPRVTLTQSDLDGVHGTVEFGTPAIQLHRFSDTTFAELLVPGVESLLGEVGVPAVPVYRQLIAVPPGAQVTARVWGDPHVEQYDSTDWDYLLPYQPPAIDEITPLEEYPSELFDNPTRVSMNAAAYESDANFPREVVRFTPVGMLRDLEVGLLEIAAAQYNPAKKRLDVFRSVEWDVEFKSGERYFLPREAKNPFERPAELYGSVLNAEAAFEHYQPGDFEVFPCGSADLGEELLILTHPDFRAAADTLAAWKEQKGIVTSVFEVGTGTARDTSAEIKDLIEFRYDNCTIRPSYAMLLGDAEFVPTHYVSGGAAVKANQDVDNGQWNLLGTINFGDTGGEYVQLSRTARDEDTPDLGATVADAVRLVKVGTGEEVIVDNDGPGFSTEGAWYTSGAVDQHGATSVYTTEVDALAKFTPADLPGAGLYEVYAWWSAETINGGTYNRDSTARYAVYSASMGSDVPYTQVADGFLGFLPALAVARMPVDTLAQATAAIDKLIAYEKTPPGSIGDSSFYDHALVAAAFEGYRGGDPAGRDIKAFVEGAEKVRNTLQALGYSVDRVYGKTEGDNPEQGPPTRYYNGALLPADLRASSGFPWDGVAQDVIDGINDGRFLVIHRDHANPFGWAHPGFNRDHVNNDLTNGSETPFVYSINCASGHFDNETSGPMFGTAPTGSYFAERLARKAVGGAVAVIAASRNSSSVGNTALIRGLVDATFPTNMPEFGDATPIRRLGDILNYGKYYVFTQVGVASTFGTVEGTTAVSTLYNFQAFGDPTLEMWTSNPHSIALPDVIAVGPIVEPKVFTFTYGQNGSGDGATLTVFQRVGDEITPLGRGTVVGGVANIPLLLEGDPDQPIIVGACRDDATCVVPVVQRLDFGDAPPPYPTLFAANGARHVVGPLSLGTKIDADPDGQPQAAALGDDSDADGDDDDGVRVAVPFAAGSTARIEVVASGSGVLNAFFDFNRNGIWEAGAEHALADRAVQAGSQFFSIVVPATISSGTVFARFRISTTPGLGPTGLASTGEVEDYQFSILPPTPPVTAASSSVVMQATRLATAIARPRSGADRPAVIETATSHAAIVDHVLTRLTAVRRRRLPASKSIDIG